MRKCWLPKRAELPEQCVSCPFREDNDVEFGAIVGKLRMKMGLDGPVTPEVIVHGREQVRLDMKFTGDFICHLTAYDAAMNRKPPEEARQCPGASKFWRSGVL